MEALMGWLEAANLMMAEGGLQAPKLKEVFREKDLFQL